MWTHFNFVSLNKKHWRHRSTWSRSRGKVATSSSRRKQLQSFCEETLSHYEEFAAASVLVPTDALTFEFNWELVHSEHRRGCKGLRTRKLSPHFKTELWFACAWIWTFVRHLTPDNAESLYQFELFLCTFIKALSPCEQNTVSAP